MASQDKPVKVLATLDDYCSPGFHPNPKCSIVILPGSQAAIKALYPIVASFQLDEQCRDAALGRRGVERPTEWPGGSPSVGGDTRHSRKWKFTRIV